LWLRFDKKNCDDILLLNCQDLKLWTWYITFGISDYLFKKDITKKQMQIEN